jgi:hypothetical protein
MQRALDQAISSLGAPVTDGDVGAFVKKVAGDRIAERRAKLTAAIEQADNAPSGHSNLDSPSAKRASNARGAPLPTTFAGIIPVSLDDAPPPPPSATTTTKTTAAVALSTVGSTSIVTPARSRRSASVLVLLGVLASIGAIVFAMRAGHLPWLTERLAFLMGARGGSLASSPESAPPVSPVLAAPPADSAAQPYPIAPADPTVAFASAPSDTAAPADTSAPAPAAPSASASAAAAPSASAPAQPFVNPQPRDVYVPRPNGRPQRKLLGNPYD